TRGSCDNIAPSDSWSVATFPTFAIVATADVATFPGNYGLPGNIPVTAYPRRYSLRAITVARPQGATLDDGYTDWAITDSQSIRSGCGDDQSIAFVSGNFNIVHPGHLRLLRFAAEQADRLVVGVNADDAPGVTLPQDVRLENVRSIGFVDH